MTTLCERKIRCSLCGSESEYTEIRSTNAFGSADLDMRPPEMERSTIDTWVQRCPKCGYCESEVSTSRPGAKALVKGKEYRNQLNDPACPELANSFLCKSILDREAADYAAATWAIIHAAWACDDSHRAEQARACRYKAAEMLIFTEEHGQQVIGQEGASNAILVDLLRRSGQVDRARQVISAKRGGISVDVIARILDYQTVLIDQNDLSCHTIALALGKVPRRGKTRTG